MRHEDSNEHRQFRGKAHHFCFPELRKAVKSFQKDRIQAFEVMVDGVKLAEQWLARPISGKY